MAWWLPACPGWLWDSGACGDMATTQNPRPTLCSCTYRPHVLQPLQSCPCSASPLPLVRGVLMCGLNSMSPCSLVPMADVPLLRCGPCHLERVGGRAGRRSRRLPGKEGLIFPTFSLSVPRELWDLPDSMHTSPLTLGPHKGHFWVVGTPFTAITRWELYAVNKQQFDQFEHN